MINNNFSYSIITSKPSNEVFELLLDVSKWWNGLHNEKTNGHSKKIEDEFSFSAGDGVHYSKHTLVELIPQKRIAWLVTDSKLNFLQKPDEWNGTKICFDILNKNKKTTIIFTHDGLIPKIECYNRCTGAWTKYLKKLEQTLSDK